MVERFHDGVAEIAGVPGHHQRQPGRTRWPSTCTVRFDDDVTTPSVHRGRRARLGRARRVRGAGPGPPGLGAGPAASRCRARCSAPCSATPSRPASGSGRRRPSPGASPRSPTGRWPWPPRRRPGGLAGARVLVVGAGEMGEGVAQALAGHGAVEPWSWPTARPTGPRRVVAGLPGTVAAAGRAPRPWTTWPTCWPRPTWSSPRSAPPTRSSTGPCSRRRLSRRATRRAAAGGRPRRPPQRRARRPPGSTGLVLLDMEVLAGGGGRRPLRAPGGGGRRPTASSPTRSSGTGWPRGPATPPRWCRPCGPGWRRPGRPSSTGSGRSGRSSSEAQWEQVDAVTRAMVAKLLHQPTVVLKDAAGTPRGERLVEALRTPVRPLSGAGRTRRVAPSWPTGRLRLATRGSPLALWQAQRVAGLLARPGWHAVAGGGGDRRRPAARRAARPARRPGGLRQGGPGRGGRGATPTPPCTRPRTCPPRPSAECPGLVLAAFPERADPRDVLVGGPARHPAHRGHGGHRVGPAPGAAGQPPARPHLHRPAGQPRHPAGRRRRRAGSPPWWWPRRPSTGWGGRPRPGLRDRGARAGRHAPPGGPRGAGRRVPAPTTRRPGRRWRPSTTPPSRPLVEAERAFLAELGGGCTLPVGAHAGWAGAEPAGPAPTPAAIRLTGMVASADGRVVLRHAAIRRPIPTTSGRAVARYLLDDAGGGDLGEWGEPRARRGGGGGRDRRAGRRRTRATPDC